MDRNGIVAAVLLFLIVADVSDASLLSNFRRFVAVASAGSSKVPPSPSPDPNKTSNNTSSNDPKVSNNSDKVDSSSKSSKDTLTAEGNDKNHGKTNNKDTKMDSQSEVGLNCTGFPRRCSDGNKLVACILNFENEHKKFVVLVQNEGESNVKVDISAPNPTNNTKLEIPKHQTRKITLIHGNSNEVTLKTGDGECILHTDLSVSQGNFFLHFPSYDELITPINGAYFLIITVLVFGGTLLCCLCRKRRRHDGIPYQELEMGLPESSLANNVETAEGWDQGWDDDWDEENAVKSPAAHCVGSISSNGLTSRSLKKDQWENDWDD